MEGFTSTACKIIKPDDLEFTELCKEITPLENIRSGYSVEKNSIWSDEPLHKKHKRKDIDKL